MTDISVGAICHRGRQMNKAIVMKFAASAALLGTVAVGCKPASHPAALSSVAPRADRQAAKLADKATEALARQDAPAAVRFAEEAVAFAPREASYRVLLGRAYIAAGRFSSAEAVLADALVLAPGDGRATLNLALTRVALGKWDQARDMLGNAKGRIGESDRGLALALAGDKTGGVEVLEAAARAEGAGVQARQNLALGYALAGRWAESRSVAAQDLAPQLLRARMSEWAQMSQPKDAWDQVAAVLHVTPIEDVGMPVALALAPSPAGQSVALAEPAAVAAVAPTPESQVEVAAAVPATPPVEVAVAALSPAATPVEIPAIAQASLPPARLMEVAAITPPPLIAAPAGRVRLPVRAPLRQSAGGRYVVQLGAFSSVENARSAWRLAVRRIDRIAGIAPSQAVFSGQGTAVHRLSLAGFETRSAATGLCERIRSSGGTCFVRAVAGDMPVRWAWRPASLLLASR